MINITEGYPLSSNESTPGVCAFHINTARLASITPTTGGPVTAFTTVGGAGTWEVFECDNGEGDFLSTGGAGSGGLGYNLGGNYRIGGLTQDKLNLVKALLTSVRVPIIAERVDGSFELLTRKGASFNTVAIGSGLTLGAANTIGSAITFTAFDSEAPASVTVATTLDAITDN